MRTEEYETILIYNPVRRVWEAGTNIPTHQAMFEKRGWTFTGETPSGDKGYEAPKNAITFRDLNKRRVMTEEQKEAARERMLALRRPISNE
jgi:hypothetical protein